MRKIIKVISGGQSGVDRAALDIAKYFCIFIGGWIPKNRWAEDTKISKEKYPELKETPLKNINQRTVWNVKDSDATLIISLNIESSGTEITKKAIKIFKKPFFIINDKNDISNAIKWLKSFSKPIKLNIAGPRESEYIGIYKKSSIILFNIFINM